jgi:hypothetical protein
MIQNDIEYSQSHSRVKLDKQLEKLNRNKGKIDQEIEFENLMCNIEKEL